MRVFLRYSVRGNRWRRTAILQMYCGHDVKTHLAGGHIHILNNDCAVTTRRLHDALCTTRHNTIIRTLIFGWKIIRLESWCIAVHTKLRHV